MGLVTGTVTLSLTEVDSLRDQIKSGEQKVLELNKELTEVRADKRVLKITRVENSTIGAPFSIDIHSIVQVFRDYNAHGYNRGLDYRELERRVQRCISSTAMFSVNPEEKTEFVNFSDVKEQLRLEMDQEIVAEIGTLRENVKKHIQRQSELTEEYNQKAIDLGIDYNKKLTDLRTNQANVVESLEEEKKTLEKKYDDLLYDRDTRTTQEKLEKQIEELKKELAEQKTKKWYQR